MKPQTASWYCLEASFEYLIDPKCCLLSVLLHNMYQGRGNAYTFLNIPSDNKSILQHFISEKVEKKKKKGSLRHSWLAFLHCHSNVCTSSKLS